jgi:hypothetical protein
VPAADETTPDGPPADPPPDRGRNKAVTAAVITSVGTVAAALIAGVLTLYGSGSGDTGREQADHKPAAGADTSAHAPDGPAGPGAPDSSSPAPAASVSTASSAVRYTGSVRIAEAGPDLDSVPPELASYDYDVHLGLVDPPRLSGGLGSGPVLAVWPGRTMPARKQCSDLVSTQGVGQVKADTGSVVCLRTDAGRTAVLTVTSTSDSFTTGVLAQATVWSEVSD